MKSKKANASMLSPRFMGMALAGSVGLSLLIGVVSLAVYAAQGDPIPGVDVSVEQSPIGIISAPMTLTSLKDGYSATGRITFSANGDQSGTVAATLPLGYTILSAPDSSLSSACFSSFRFNGTRLTATKNNCTGTLTLAGMSIALPSIGQAQPTPTTISTPTNSTPTPAGTTQNYNSSKSNTGGIVDAKTCISDANKSHETLLKKIASTQTADLLAARKAYNDAIKAAQATYQAALKKIPADAKNAKASADASWKEMLKECSTTR